jgi:DNA-binding MarR family transcriptional regulator
MLSFDRVLHQLAKLVPQLRHGELRLLLYFWSAAITTENPLIERSFRELEKATGLSLRRVQDAVRGLRQRDLVRVRRGGGPLKSHFILRGLYVHTTKRGGAK